ncbi:MAG TPA: hypothetical protein VFW66_12540 [Gemmatimonadales bacterium]|nr:hypothetical protein [Gemmatimonadales bacterium]
MACEILRDLRDGARARDCRVEGYRDTAAAYVLRVREIAEGAGSADAPISEVRLTKDGLSATLTRIPQP